MVTVSKTVIDMLNKRVFLQEAINREIVSYNQLAKHLRPDIEQELGKPVKHSAVVMSLRRYGEKLEKKKENIKFNYFRETILKTDICYILIAESATSICKVQNLYNQIEFKHGGIYNIVHGNYEVGIITNQRYKETLLELLQNEKISQVVEDLVLISLTHTQNFLFTPGVLYNVIRFVAWENINLFSIILTPQELSLVIPRIDAMKCYNTLERLVKPKSAICQ
jgi:hypothetical protein